MLEYLPPSSPPPPINNNPHHPPPSLFPTSPLYSRGETTDFLPAPSVCFSKRQYTSIYHFGMFRITESPHSNALQPVGLFSFLLLSSLVSLIYTMPPPFTLFLPSQTPSGLLLAHSPLLSGIHFWSSLSPVAPLSPARLQGHSSLFQVRKHTGVDAER